MRSLVATLLLCLISACGYKGPLYLPPKAKPAAPATATPPATAPAATSTTDSTADHTKSPDLANPHNDSTEAPK